MIANYFIYSSILPENEKLSQLVIILIFLIMLFIISILGDILINHFKFTKAKKSSHGI